MSLQDRKLVKEAAAHASESEFYEHADGDRFEISLPRLCGARQGADALVNRISKDLLGKIVVLNARRTTVGTTAYADELLSLLHMRGAGQFELTGSPEEFKKNLLHAAELRRLNLTVL